MPSQTDRSTVYKKEYFHCNLIKKTKTNVIYTCEHFLHAMIDIIIINICVTWTNTCTNTNEQNHAAA